MKGKTEMCRPSTLQVYVGIEQGPKGREETGSGIVKSKEGTKELLETPRVCKSIKNTISKEQFEQRYLALVNSSY